MARLSARPNIFGPPRRAFLWALCAALVAVPHIAGASDILMVSRERLLRESEAASQLREAEEVMTRQLQASVDAAKAQLAAEEAELTELRQELEAEAFEERAQDFDRRIRAVRREAQERAAFLQRGFQEARATLVAALPELLEQVRRNAKADVILNADNVLAAADGVDVTAEVIALMDAEGPRPPAPKIDLTEPLLAPALPVQPEGEANGQ